LLKNTPPRLTIPVPGLKNGDALFELFFGLGLGCMCLEKSPLLGASFDRSNFFLGIFMSPYLVKYNTHEKFKNYYY